MRYIDANELIEFFDSYPDHIEFDVEDIKSIINEQDAADVVEIGKPYFYEEGYVLKDFHNDGVRYFVIERADT